MIQTNNNDHKIDIKEPIGQTIPVPCNDSASNQTKVNMGIQLQVGNCKFCQIALISRIVFKQPMGMAMIYDNML